jgi:hypothetical protein
VFPYRLEACAKHIEYAAKDYLLDGGQTNKSAWRRRWEGHGRAWGSIPTAICHHRRRKSAGALLNHVYDRLTKYRKDYPLSRNVPLMRSLKNSFYTRFIIWSATISRRLGNDVRKV